MIYYNYLLFIFTVLKAASKLNSTQNYHQSLLINGESNEDLKKLNLVMIKMGLKNFEQVTSIGYCCLPKFRIVSFLSKNSIQKNNINTNHLFDWSEIYNYTRFGESLQNEFNDAFGLNYLKVRHDMNCFGIKSALYNEKYDFAFIHAFDGVKGISHSNIFSLQDFHDNYHFISEKFDYLSKNSRKAFSGVKRTLYLGYSLDKRREKQEEYLNLLRIIKSKRDTNFLLLILVTDNFSDNDSYEFDTILEDNLVFHKIKYYELLRWHSFDSIKQWDDILKVVLR